MPPLMGFDEVRRYHENHHADQVAAARARPVVKIWDKNHGVNPGKTQYLPVAEVFGEIDGDFEEILNDTGPGSLNLYASHPLRDWLIDEVAEAEDVHVTVDLPGWRWHGKALTITEVQDEDGIEYVRIAFQHGFEHSKKIICFSNPFLPAIAQAPKHWNWAGNSITAIHALMFCNLWRRYAPGWQLPDDIFAPGGPQGWLANLNPSNWPQIVLPPLTDDTSMWCIITTRFGNFHDVIKGVLEDAGLMLQCTQWLPGDPQPRPSHFTLTKPTLLWECVDVSGVRGPFGNTLDGLLKLTSSLTEDFLEEVVTASDWGDAPAQYSSPTFFGTIRDFPWVVWRNSMRRDRVRGSGESGIRSWHMTIHKALAGAVVTGGRSPAWLNASVKLLLNAGLGYLGALIGNPGLALGIFDKQVEDVLLAFQRVAFSLRQAIMGRSSYGEHWEQGTGEGFSLSTLSTIRLGRWNTRAYTSFKIKVVNMAPFWIGRHIGLGGRAAGEIGRSGRLYVDTIHSVRLTWSRTKDPDFELALGTDKEEEAPTSRLGRLVEKVKAGLQIFGVDM
ncbi:MAG: hypothetical protein WBA00_11450 [Rhodococcus sp. (in: high G+C Gram-positive bacteria)]